MWSIVVLAAALSCGCSDAGTYRHVILISLDTTRADQLGCYGNARARTPNLDRLASQGVVFRHAMAAAPTTLASHTSLMTGLYPHTHGVVRNGFDVAAENEMLAETLKRAGFATAAFLGSAALDARFGFDQGFDVFDDSFDIARTQTMFDQFQRRADGVTDAAVRFVESSSADRLFLFAHYFDVHTPYDPPAPFDRAFVREGGPTRAGPADFEQAVRAHQQRTAGQSPGLEGAIKNGLTSALVRKADGVATPQDADLQALYLGELEYVDREIGRLLEALDKKGFLERAIVIVTSDHGETFAEHGDYWNHGLWVYETTVHVPLVVWTSDGRAPRSIEPAVSHVDVMPTLLEMLDIAPPKGIEGASLVPLLEGEGARFERGPIFSEATLPPQFLEQGQAWGNALKPKCVRVGDWKYVYAPYLELEELYDLARDPAERHDLLARLPIAPESRAKADELRAVLAKWSASARPRASTAIRKPRDDRRAINEMMKGLGYPGVGDDPEPPSTADPKPPSDPPPK